VGSGKLGIGGKAGGGGCFLVRGFAQGKSLEPLEKGERKD